MIFFIRVIRFSDEVEVEYLLDDPEAEAAVNSDLESDSIHKLNDESVMGTIEVEEQKPQICSFIEENLNIECCLCETTFCDVDACIGHINECHMEALEEHLTFRNKHKIFRFFCPICQKGFRRKMSIDMHLTNKNFIEKPAKKSIDAKKWRKPTQCQACGKLFSDKCEAMYHYDRIHEKNKTIKCRQCDKLFATQKILNRHMISHKPKSLKCPKCEKSFPQVSQLRSHMDTHLSVKKFKCDLCPKTFSHKRVLETHILQHSELKPFKCTECPKMYKWPEDLNGHKKAEHEGIFPYFCLYCNKGYTSSSNKKYHESRCSLNPEKLK